MFDSRDYMAPFVASCSDKDRKRILELADVSHAAIVSRKRLLSLTENSHLPNRWNAGLFAELTFINQRIFREPVSASPILTMICSCGHLWLCGARFGQIDDSSASTSVMNGLRASAPTPEFVTRFGELLWVIGCPENPNLEAAFFSLIGAVLCLYRSAALTLAIISEARHRLPALDRPLVEVLNIDPEVLTEVSLLLTAIGSSSKRGDPQGELFDKLLQDIQHHIRATP